MGQGQYLDHNQIYQIIFLLKTTTLMHRQIAVRMGIATYTVCNVNTKYGVRHYKTRRTWTLGDDPTLIDGRDCI